MNHQPQIQCVFSNLYIHNFELQPKQTHNLLAKTQYFICYCFQ